MNVSVQLYIAVLVCFMTAIFAFGVFLERQRVRSIEAQMIGARFTMPERICGAWVYNDGKGRAHHCVKDHDHGGELHRSESGMGRKTYA